MKKLQSRMSANGHVTIPVEIRRTLGIKRGTRVTFIAQPNLTIILTPVTRAYIHSLMGSLKPKPGEKPFKEQWAEYKAQERALEEAKFRRFFARSSKIRK